MKLCKFRVGRAVLGTAFGVVAYLAACAQGEDLSPAQKDGGTSRGTGGTASTGSGGSAFMGMGGANNTGGAPNLGGSFVVGSGGSTGSGGSIFSGNGGSSGGAGSLFLGNGGASPSDSGMAGGSMFDGPVAAGLQVTFRGQANSLQFNIEITNTGIDMPSVDSLKVRYYLIDEGFFDPTLNPPAVIFDSAAWKSSAMPYYSTISCTAQFVKIAPPRAGADSYFEIGCTSPAGLVLATSDSEAIQMRLQSQAFEDPTNDYSYIATDGGNTLTPNNHIVVLQGGGIAAGVEPP